MGRGSPGRIVLNGDKSLIGPGLDPPRSAVGINNNLLPWAVALDPTSYRINSFSPSLRCWRSLSEFNRWSLFAGLATTTWQNAEEGQHKAAPGCESCRHCPAERSKVALLAAGRNKT